MNYISEYDYNPEIHLGSFKKYAQVTMVMSPYGRELPTVSQIMWCDEDPDAFFKWGSRVRHVDITALPNVKCGMVLDPRSSTPNNIVFLNPLLHVRELYTDQELMAVVRRDRNMKISACDVLCIRHADQLALGVEPSLSGEQYTELLQYRQALRDFPANVDLDNIVWPPKPAFMA